MTKINKLIVIYLTSVIIFNPISPIITEIKLNPIYASPNTIRFLYDGDGVRVAKIENGKTILYVGDTEKDLSINQMTKYYSLGSKKVAVKKGNNLSFLVSDHLESLQSLTDSTGNLKSNIKYYPYGTIRIKTGEIIASRQYTSQINDDSTNLYFYNARYYNPQTANFLQADRGGNTMNKYVYVNGNPINYSDPTGNDEEGIDFASPGNLYPGTWISSSQEINSTILGPTTCLNMPEGCTQAQIDQWNTESLSMATQVSYAALNVIFIAAAAPSIDILVRGFIASLPTLGGAGIAGEQIAEKTYYHYTSVKGAEGIIRDQLIKAFTRDLWTKPLSYPKSVYMTDIPPEKLQVISVGEGLMGQLRLFWTTLESLTIKPGMGSVSAEKTTNYFTIIPKSTQEVGRSLLSYLLRQRAWVKPGDLPLNDPNFTISGPFGR